MAPHASVLLLRAVLVASAGASSPAKDEPPADKFLRACCANTTNAAICYDSLQPGVGSFEGNLIKVSCAATVNAYAKLRSFDAELCSIIRRRPGAGDDDLNGLLQSCTTEFEAVLFDEDSVLVKLRRLETAAYRRGSHADLALFDVRALVGGVPSVTGLLCMDDFLRMGNAVRVSRVGKIMLAGNATVQLYDGIALDLVASIKL